MSIPTVELISNNGIHEVRPLLPDLQGVNSAMQHATKNYCQNVRERGNAGDTFWRYQSNKLTFRLCILGSYGQWLDSSGLRYPLSGTTQPIYEVSIAVSTVLAGTVVIGGVITTYPPQRYP